MKPGILCENTGERKPEPGGNGAEDALRGKKPGFARIIGIRCEMFARMKSPTVTVGLCCVNVCCRARSEWY